MFTHSFASKLLAYSIFAAALVSGCGTQHATTANAQTLPLIAKGPATDAPDLEGTSIPVCPELAYQGLAASTYDIDNGFVIELGIYDEDRRAELQENMAESAEQRQQIEYAFEDVVATKHDDGQGIYIRFEHPEDGVRALLADILQKGIDSRPAAAKRVSIRQLDDRVEMQLPSGGPFITSRTSAAADDTVEKWTDRTPTEISYTATAYGGAVHFQSDDDERIDELRNDMVASVLACDGG